MTHHKGIHRVHFRPDGAAARSAPNAIFLGALLNRRGAGVDHATTRDR